MHKTETRLKAGQIRRHYVTIIVCGSVQSM